MEYVVWYTIFFIFAKNYKVMANNNPSTNGVRPGYNGNEPSGFENERRQDRVQVNNPSRPTTPPRGHA